MRELIISGILNRGEEKRKGSIHVDEDTGIIKDIEFSDIDRHNSKELNVLAYDDSYLIEAGDVNAHSHPEQSLYTEITDRNWDLPTWCRNTIYKYSKLLTPRLVYLGCCRAFSRMLGLGVTSVMVSFYCHNNSGNKYDREVIRAARDTGIRLYFGRMNYDIINYEAYEAKVESQKCYYETPLEAEQNFLELQKEADGKRIIIAPSVHSIHASTREAIVKAINLGNEHRRFVQFHLSEDRGDVDLSLKLYGKRPVEFLVSLLKQGEIDTLENMFLSDCVWVDDIELKLIKEYDMKVVLNPRMNDRIKTGEADIERMIKIGLNPFLGTDGEASNDDLSITGEREFLRRRFGSSAGFLADSNAGEAIKFGDAYIGKIEAGSYCDLKITKNGVIHDIIVGGEKVLKGGRLVAADLDKQLVREFGDLIKHEMQ